MTDNIIPADCTIVLGDNLSFLAQLPDNLIDLIYIDPPFNTKKRRAKTSLRTIRCEKGDRVGYGGRRYQTTQVGTQAYHDDFEDYLGFLIPRLEHSLRILKPHGSLFVHLDYREVHYIKVALDDLFGRTCFQNEIIWAYDFGARSKRRWSAKHDNILWYTKDPKQYTFLFDNMDRIPYMAPGLVTKEKAELGKTPTDCWWHTIVPTNGAEKTGYPTQKPIGIIDRIVRIHSKPGDLLLDFFAGSGTLGDSAHRNNRRCILVDNNPQAVEVMLSRLRDCDPQFIDWNKAGV